MISKGLLKSKLFFDTMIPWYLEILSQGQLVRTLTETLKNITFIYWRRHGFFPEKPEIHHRVDFLQTLSDTEAKIPSTTQKYRKQKHFCPQQLHRKQFNI